MDQEYKKRKRILPVIPPKIKPKIEDIEKFEKDKNITLPDDFKEFLKKNNDCELENHTYDFSEIDSILEFELDCTLGIDMELFELYTERKKEYIEFENDFPDLFESFLVFAYAEGGHAEICISISGNNKGNIYYVYDEDIDITFKIADSFNEFLNSSLSTYDNEFEEACDKGNQELAIELINKGLNLDIKVGESSLLNLAIRSKYDMNNLIKMLVEKGISLDSSINNASSYGKLEVVKYLFENKAPIENGITSASGKGSLPIVEFLLSKGANINENNAVTPLSYATANGHLEIVEFLLKNGADPTIKPLKSNYPFQWAELRLEQTKDSLNQIFKRLNDNQIKDNSEKEYLEQRYKELRDIELKEKKILNLLNKAYT